MSWSFAPAQGIVATDLVQGDPILGSGANRVLYSNGSQVLSSEAAFTYVESTNVLSVDTLALAVGTAGTPAITFGDADTGIYINAGNQLLFSAGGTGHFGIGVAGTQVASADTYAWSSGALNAASDTFLYREGAAIIQMGADVNGAAVAQTFKAHDGITGTDIAGANLTLAGGRGTGAGAAGQLIFQTAVPVGSGTTAQVLATALTINSSQQLLIPTGAAATANIACSTNTDTGFFFPSTTSMRLCVDAGTVVTFSTASASGGIAPNAGIAAASNIRFAHGTSALATNATEGFFHLQSCAGAPTGAPAAIPTGQIPLIYDSTNNKFYAYNGAWKKAQTAGVDVIFG